jgi:penicillin amidase
MHSRLKIIFGLLGTFIVLVAALFGFLYYNITKSFPQTSGTIELEGLRGDVKIYRDEYGIPHLFAHEDHDAYFAVGFLHGQDRLWQLELMRRAGEGRLSEVLGAPTLEIDKMFRTIGIRRLAQRLTVSLDDTTRTALQAYADGVNTFIRHSKGKYPLEFDLLGIEPEPWRIEHSVLISRLMAWELNYSRWVDITLSILVERFGPDRARELFPEWPEGAPLIVPEALRGKRIASLLETVLDAEQLYRSFIGSGGFGGGSNAWAVSGAKSVSGKPLLANDPHLMLGIPARWYEMHVVTPQFDVAGAAIVGTPFIVIGRNRFIAWGVTNAMMDDHDFYIEEVDSLPYPSKYRYKEAWRAVQQSVDTILVKDGPPVLLTVYHTHRGPIINRFEKSARFSPHLFSMRWVGHELSQELRAFYLLNRARNWQEFNSALKDFAVPAQNFLYADMEGNIGYLTGGRIPVRTTKAPTLPFPGWTDEHEWNGFVPYDDMPRLYNPPEGFVATANNKIVSDAFPHYLSNLWEPHWRISRIVEQLRAQQKFTVRDFELMQNDAVSLHARELVPIILNAHKGVEVKDADVQKSLRYFRNWDFSMGRENVATTLFQSFFIHMMKNTLEDELGKDLLNVYDTLPSIPLTVMTNMMHRGASVWFDDIRTPQVETMDEIVRKSLADGIDELRAKLGGELKEWQWGRVHEVEFKHPLGAHPLLRRFLNLGPHPTDGAHSTINNGNFSFRRPFFQDIGPSTRQIFDLADIDNGRAVTPPGQSGQAFYKQYDDQLELWRTGRYRTSVMSPERIEQAGWELLTLRPLRP